MSNLVRFAETELKRLGYSCAHKDGEAFDYNESMAAHILKMVRLFSEEQHSGFSASYAIAALGKLLKYEPLTPLTGDDDEWTEVGEGIFQNNRCPHVFKEAGGAYDSQGIIFRDPDGSTWQNGGSRVAITFPYTPSTQIVDRPAGGETVR